MSARFIRDPVILHKARRCILAKLAESGPPLHANELREHVVGGRVTESYYRGAREDLLADGAITKGMHATITDAGRTELARLTQGKAA